jgi:2,3-diketo-5-methylthio-1-phosphopentane phosphatase
MLRRFRVLVGFAMAIMHNINFIYLKMKANKNLVIFDLDQTILAENSDTCILKLLSDESLKELEGLNYGNWAKHMQHVYNIMKKENVEVWQVKEIVESIKFNDGFAELFDLLKSNMDSFDCIIVSGANTLFLKWILDKHDLHDVFPVYYSNIAQPDEECVIKINQHHEHDCEACDKSQCKRLILDCHLKSCGNVYANMFYLGDGSNDYCPSLLFSEKDYLFPRHGFPLHNKLYERNYIEKLKCKVHSWNDAYSIIDILKEHI